MSIMSMTCNNPANPYDKKNTKIYIYARSAAGATSSTGIQDSVGNTIHIGLTCYLPSNIDSVQLVTSNSVFGVFKDISSKSDTLWDSIVFSDSGTKIITGIAYISNNTTYSSSITATIHSKPVNHKPLIVVPGDTSIMVGHTCTFTLSVSDIDSVTQSYIFSALKKPTTSALDNKIFTWTPSSGNIGKDTAIFMVVDNGNPPMSDTDTVAITVSDTGSKKNRAPQWEGDTINLSGSVGSKISLTLTEACSDSDGDALTYTLMPGTPAGDTIIGGVWSFTPAAGDTETYYAKIIAKDPSGLSDTVYLHITITAVDTTGPTVTLVNPSTDTISTNSSSYQIKLKCIDASSIASVIGVTGSVTDTGKKSTDSIYTITVSNLTQEKYDTVNITVTDNSARANKTRLSVKIKYDPTLTDKTGPTITKISGPVDTVSAASFTLVDSIFDPSGVDSVYGKLNSGIQTVLVGTSNKYTYTGTLSEGSNTIVITAKDKSTAGNWGTQTISVVYIKAPTITTQPTAQTACPSSSASFSVTASGTGTLTYTWYKGAIVKGTASTYTISSVTAGDTGYYKVTVSNYSGLVTSDSVKLSLTRDTVTFNSNSGTSVSSQTIICGSKATQPTNPTYTGYRFDGWYTTSGFSSIFSFKTTPITSNITLYAKWTPVYTVTYNANGGTGTVPSDTTHYESGDSVIVLGGTGLAKTNYAFKYWATASNGSGKTYSAGSKVGITNSNVTLYAQWIRRCTITFDNQGATTNASPSTMTVDSGSTVGSLPTEPAKKDCIFANWYPLTVGRGSKITTSTTVTADVTVYALWTVKDADGNVYNTVYIGTQTWMAENLRVSKYRGGTSISAEWYNNDSSTTIYGKLYQGSMVADSMAPTGWHVPTSAEWNTLINYVGNYTTAGGILKETGTAHWLYPNTGATNNTYGFTALPGGSYTMFFSQIDSTGYWWSSDNYEENSTYYRKYIILYYNSASVDTATQGVTNFYDYSIRCIKD
jgi:uncharacterized protein (TIGR02145 family)/uncharacterized repeat protein (TIGR02543 family)